MAQLGVSPAQTLYVGDMEVDIETGRNAGVETWVMPTGSHNVAKLAAARAQRIFNGMPEVIDEVLATKQTGGHAE
jgi:phosphoglycolate phosphatase